MHWKSMEMLQVKRKGDDGPSLKGHSLRGLSTRSGRCEETVARPRPINLDDTKVWESNSS